MHSREVLTPVNIYLDEETNHLLEQSILLSSRTKRQEATLRVIDHLHSFKDGEFMRARISVDDKVAHVNIYLSPFDNGLLKSSVEWSKEGVTKREEAGIRLKDHLRRYSGIAFLGKVIER